jgi:DNA polymerase (family X)
VDFDFERVLGATVATGIALEVNASPYRLDLTDTMARAAQEAGALLAINSDAHSVAQLEQIRYGVFQARPCWVEAHRVVNTWGWGRLDRWLKACGKRA